MKCNCGNDVVAGSDLCEWCESIAGELQHVGHTLWFTGAWYCDTCKSPVCELS